jgi:hypothetical protein
MGTHAMRRARTTLLFIAVLIGFGVVGLLIVFFGSSTNGPKSLAFTGFVKVRASSDAPMGELAAFAFTNGAPTHIVYYVESIEYQTADAWLTNTLRRTPTEWRHFGGELGPFESRVLLVPPPTNGVWRLRIGGSERARGIKGLLDRLRDYRDFFDWKTRSLTGERFGGQTFQVVSGEVAGSK